MPQINNIELEARFDKKILRKPYSHHDMQWIILAKLFIENLERVWQTKNQHYNKYIWEFSNTVK